MLLSSSIYIHVQQKGKQGIPSPQPITNAQHTVSQFHTLQANSLCLVKVCKAFAQTRTTANAYRSPEFKGHCVSVNVWLLCL